MKVVDRTGQRFSRLLVLSRAGSDRKKNATWLCVCDCGNESVVAGHQLAGGRTKSCGCLAADTKRNTRLAISESKPLVGARFGYWTIEHVDLTGKRSMASVVCICGARRRVHIYSIERGESRSCGCVRDSETASRMTKHGKFGEREYRTWSGMLARCRNRNEANYPDYGGRGIKVCSRWLSFENFYEDMGDCPPRRSIDRIDVNGDYEPGNCRWATDHEQARNKRNNKLSSAQAAEIRAATKAKTETQAAIARRFGVSTSLISHIHTGRAWAGV